MPKRKLAKLNLFLSKVWRANSCIVQPDIVNLIIYFDGKEDNSRVQKNEKGLYEADLKKGENVIFTSIALKEADLSMETVEFDLEN